MEKSQRDTADEELVDFLSGAVNYDIVFFDTETNGFPTDIPFPSVLSVSAIRAKLTSKDNPVEGYSVYNRYYFPEEDYKQDAIKVNGLTEEVISQKRKEGDQDDKIYFEQDYPAFVKFCEGVSLFVGHNAQEFDSKFIPCIDWTKVRIFDTMLSNSDIICSSWNSAFHFYRGKKIWTPGWKAPKLMEAAKFYGIGLEETELHGSLYDTKVTMQVFFEMLKRSSVRLRKF
jgi:DNA polymerase III epsilon subunit-like protein